MPTWRDLSERDVGQFHTTLQFLETRLAERETVEWALRLSPSDRAKRMAVLHLLSLPRGRELKEPWRTVWAMIEEAWRTELDRRDLDHLKYDVAQRIKSGDRTGATIASVVDLVRPFLSVTSRSERILYKQNRRERAKHPEDLVYARLRSGNLVDPSEINLGSVNETSFLVELANDLDAATTKGLAIARRLGWSEDQPLWPLGDLRRAYFVSARELPEDQHEPDAFHKGIAPVVKLLHAVVRQLSQFDATQARKFLAGWSLQTDRVHKRLWAALAREQHLVTGSEVAAYLQQLKGDEFWNLHEFPEIAALRAIRYKEFVAPDNQAIISRVLKGPSRGLWSYEKEPAAITEAQIYWTVRELRRIQISGANLPSDAEAWLRQHSARFPELQAMKHVEDGFLGTSKARWIPAAPDAKFQTISGQERLQALEAALGAPRRGFEDNTGQGAADWITANAELLVGDFESAESVDYPLIWDRLSWAHLSRASDDAKRSDRASSQIDRVIALIMQLSQSTLVSAIDGFTYWLEAAAEKVGSRAELIRAWHRLWPFAVERTNSQQPPSEEPSLNVVVQQAEGGDPDDLDTLNTPAGRLVGAFLKLCPSLDLNADPFSNLELKGLRDASISATGRSGLISKHRLIEHLQWFIKAAPDWTHANLILSLQAKNNDAVALWRAVARRPLFRDVIKIIGEEMILRASDVRLGRDARQSLIFSLVVEILHSFLGNRQAAISRPAVQQMIRSLEPEVRGYAAEVPTEFLKGMSSTQVADDVRRSVEVIFRDAVRPFLAQVWPQERSLATPGVARALADLPAAAGDEFENAVVVIEPFLVPFECWSLLDYGFFGRDHEGAPKLSKINTPGRALALLRMLNATIGAGESAVVPHDLGEALSQIQDVSPDLQSHPMYRRLNTLSRR